jgi:hypothetical protein
LTGAGVLPAGLPAFEKNRRRIPMKFKHLAAVLAVAVVASGGANAQT